MTNEMFQLVTFANTITYVLPRIRTGILCANDGSWPLKLARYRVTQRRISVGYSENLQTISEQILE